MKQKELANAFDLLEPTQEVKYKIKNTIHQKSEKRRPFIKRSVSAMVSVVLASILVITAAAVGGIALFKSIYGDNLEPIMPYSEQINLTASDENYELTLHEAVADEYTTAYIFSVKRLTIGASEAPKNENPMIFSSYQQINSDADDALKYCNPQENPEYFKAFNGYDIFDHQIYRYERLVLIRTNTAYDADNEARYLVRKIDNLKTADTDYYALYVINGEEQMLNIGVAPLRDIYGGLNGGPYRGLRGGPELTLPKVTQKAPSVTRSVQEYYRQYLKQNHPTLIFNNASLSDMITITPLAVYINNTDGYQYKHYYESTGSNYYIRYMSNAFYRTAELIFNDGTEKLLSEMSQNEMGIRLTPTTGVYLFDEVLDTSLIKSFMVYDTVEFPMDVSLPVMDRGTGAEIVPKYEAIDLLYDMGTNLANYLDSMYPEERKEGTIYFGKPGYINENSCKINGLDCEIVLTAYDSTGEVFSDATKRMLEEYRTKFEWTVSDIMVKNGTCSLGNVRYADITANISGGEVYHTHVFFFETGGKLVTAQLIEKENVWPYYSLNALLKLITFE